jgi:hypothetical protein
MRLWLLTVAMVAASTSAWAETPKAVCAKLSEEFNYGATGVRKSYTSVDKFYTGGYAQMLSGDERNALDEMEAARKKLLPEMKEFTEKLEDLAYQLQKCAQ